jgi:small-conductance mechanosensitive channel
MVGDFILVLLFSLFAAMVVYLVFSLIRRRQQNAMQKHLLDKFSSAQDFSEFVQSPAGQKYVAGFSDRVADPHASILNSVRIGIVVLFLGIALFLVRTVNPDGYYFFRGLATVLTLLGIGFVVSSMVSYQIAKRIKSEQVN